MTKFNLDQKLEELQKRYDELSLALSSPEVINDRNQYTRYAKEHAELSNIVALYQKKKSLDTQLEENKELLNDPDDGGRNGGPVPVWYYSGSAIVYYCHCRVCCSQVDSHYEAHRKLREFIIGKLSPLPAAESYYQ